MILEVSEVTLYKRRKVNEVSRSTLLRLFHEPKSERPTPS